MKTSVFIPCIPKHWQGLAGVIQQYLTGTLVPDEIVIGLSECDVIGKDAVNELEKKFWPTVKVVMVRKRLYTGPCAQLAEFFCAGDVIIYQAADDLPHSRRVEIVDRYFTNYDIVALNHSFIGSQSPDKFKGYDWDKIKVVQPLDLVKWDKEEPDDVYGQRCGFPVAAGTICVRSKVLEDIKWSWAPKGQDGIYCKQVLRKYKRSIIIDCPLYYYSK